jgi:hypothetical protein
MHEKRSSSAHREAVVLKVINVKSNWAIPHYALKSELTSFFYNPEGNAKL